MYLVQSSASDLLDGNGSLLPAPMREEEVMKWSWTGLGCLRILRVFSELPGSTGSRSSGSIRGLEEIGCSDSDEGFVSVSSGAVSVWSSAGDKYSKCSRNQASCS